MRLKIKKLISVKLKDRRGISLAELLVTIIFCLMTFALVCTAMQAASRSLKKSTMQSESELLCSTLTISIEDVLRYAGSGSVENASGQESGIIVDGSTSIGDPSGIRFFSRSRGVGNGAYLQNSNDGHIILKYQPEGGSGNELYADMAPDSAYTQGMKASLYLVWNQDNTSEEGKKKYGTFTGKVTVTDSQGNELNSQEFAVAPLNINR